MRERAHAAESVLRTPHSSIPMLRSEPDVRVAVPRRPVRVGWKGGIIHSSPVGGCVSA
ncbi:hypothetical protein PJP10_29075 [Mycobacterium kansasii]